jgi:8-oxo-dGTP pyrophosphatase MutT (NUDIX family)
VDTKTGQELPFSHGNGTFSEGDLVSYRTNIKEKSLKSTENIEPHSHCHFCGTAYASKLYPLTCSNEECKRQVWFNPLAVAIVAIPVLEHGFLGVRRNIHPKGKLCFPSGYIEKHETWQAGAVREVREETGLIIPEESIRLLTAVSTESGFLCLLCMSETLVPMETPIDMTFTSDETQELLFMDENTEELAFPIQDQFLRTIYKNTKNLGAFNGSKFKLL